jgi:hypothetical protein
MLRYLPIPAILLPMAYILDMSTRFRLQELIDEAGTNQSALARAAGMSVPTVNRLCNHAPTHVALGTVDKILAGFQALGHSYGVADLIEWTPPKARKRVA